MEEQIGFYQEDGVISCEEAFRASGESQHHVLRPEKQNLLLQYLAADPFYPMSLKEATEKVYGWLVKHPDRAQKLKRTDYEILLPIERPNKLLLLAGNYAEHIIERGGTVAEREETFPYVFMKPPSTTLIPSQAPIVIPKNAPWGVDWECELAVVMGRKVRNISEQDAPAAIAGYTIVNDISQRQFKPNPTRKRRERDVFFDWQHGKWFDSFCPCGPALLVAGDQIDPQKLKLRLTVNGEVKQEGSTGQMIFSVAAIVAFISTFVTLEPGDIISTGTPKGVGSVSGIYLKPGDEVEASIEGIGLLRNSVVAEK
jgi:2-keto-4-pentenoate hydratase/2-oxohepta-3-ene-1,7-dioic acid hydratase in catechol pathway